MSFFPPESEGIAGQYGVGRADGRIGHATVKSRRVRLISMGDGRAVKL